MELCPSFETTRAMHGLRVMMIRVQRENLKMISYIHLDLFNFLFLREFCGVPRTRGACLIADHCAILGTRGHGVRLGDQDRVYM